MADITFDLDALKEAEKSVKLLVDNLDADKRKLNESLSKLKSEWNTVAGKKFFDEHSDWEKSVTLYSKKLTGVVNMLKKAISEYEAIVNEANNLSV